MRNMGGTSVSGATNNEQLTKPNVHNMFLRSQEPKEANLDIFFQNSLPSFLGAFRVCFKNVVNVVLSSKFRKAWNCGI